MNNESSFFKRLERITLGTASSARQRTFLSAYADSHPVVASAPTPTFFSVLMQSRRFPLYATLTALLVCGTGGATLAAEGSAPGDAFYNIKIHVNEPLMSALSPSTEGQARVSSELAARRVDEVVQLAQAGRLTDEKQQYLDDAFTQEVTKAKVHAAALAREGNIDAAVTVSADLNVHLAGEAQALASVQASAPVKTKAFLQKVLAISGSEVNQDENDQPAVGTQEDSHEQKDTHEPVHVGLVSMKSVSKVGSTTAATTTKYSARPRTVSAKHPESLFITASTSLSRLLSAPASDVLPKTDRAIQVQVQSQPTDDIEGLNILR